VSHRDRAQRLAHHIMTGRGPVSYVLQIISSASTADRAALSQAAVTATRRKADAYRRENRALLANYDDWLESMISDRGSHHAL